MHFEEFRIDSHANRLLKVTIDVPVIAAVQRLGVGSLRQKLGLVEYGAKIGQRQYRLGTRRQVEVVVGEGVQVNRGGLRLGDG